jgi:predicted MFS family arabinose efflux permease
MPLQPGLLVGAVLFLLTGVPQWYYTVAQAEIVRHTPDAFRGQISGLYQTVMRTAMGGGVLLYGLLADYWSPSVVIGGTGIAGVLVAGVIGVAWQRQRVIDPIAGVPAGVGEASTMRSGS